MLTTAGSSLAARSAKLSGAGFAPPIVGRTRRASRAKAQAGRRPRDRQRTERRAKTRLTGRPPSGMIGVYNVILRDRRASGQSRVLKSVNMAELGLVFGR